MMAYASEEKLQNVSMLYTCVNKKDAYVCML